MVFMTDGDGVCNKSIEILNKIYADYKSKEFVMFSVGFMSYNKELLKTIT
jgi:hypothetical protein